MRVDGYVYEGWEVPVHYDPLLAKLICWGATRQEALARLRRALDEYVIAGIQTNIPFFRRLVERPEFLRGELDTELIHRMLKEGAARPAVKAPAVDAAAVAAAVTEMTAPRNGLPAGPSPSRWRQAGRQAALRGPERGSR